MLRERWLFLWQTMLDEWKHIFTQKSLLLVLFGLPVIYPVIISGLYMHKQVVERPAIVVDRDNSSLSREFTINLDATQGMEIVGHMEDLGEAWKKIKNQEAEALIFIPDDFSSDIKKGKHGQVKLWINSADVLTYSSSYPSVSYVSSHMNEKLGREYLYNLEMDNTTADMRVMPIKSNVLNMYHPSINYSDFVVIPILLVVLQQIILIGMSFSLSLRRESGKLKLHPRFPFTAIEGKMLAQFVFYFIGSVFMIFAVVPFFDWPVVNSWSMLFIFMAMTLALAPMSMIIAILMKDRFEAFQILMLYSTPAFLASGYTWPFEKMPMWVQALASMLPISPALQALFSVSLKDGNLLALLPYFGWLAALFFFYLTAAILILRYIGRKQKGEPLAREIDPIKG